MINPMLTSYQDQGFYIGRQMINPNTLMILKKEMHRIYKDQLGIMGLPCPDDLYEAMKCLFDRDLERYLATARVITQLQSIYDVFFSVEIKKAIKDLNLEVPTIPTGPAVHIVSPSLKPPGGYSELGAHQDWSSMQGSLDALIIWVPFSDVPKDFFPLEAIPRSHLRGFLEGTVEEHLYVIKPELYQESDFVPLEMNLGDALFFSSFTVHRTSAIGPTHKGRLACSLRFENAMDPSFAKRKYPCAYKRIVARQLIDDNFPKLDDLKPIFPSIGSH